KVVQFVAIDALGEIEEVANRPPKRLEQRGSVFDLPDHRFIKIKSALDVETKVLTTLRFYASGSYQLDTASNKHFCMTQSSASRCIREVTEALNQDEVLNRPQYE
ncbi:hypothetical protein ILUMI_17901, partial [Ignelater luminosus]